MLDATGLPRGSAVTCNICGYTIAMYSNCFKSHFTYIEMGNYSLKALDSRSRHGLRNLLTPSMII